MTINRRKFLRNTALGGIAFAGGSSFFFPKPVSSYKRINYLLSKEGTSDAIFKKFVVSAVARDVGNTLPPETPSNVVRAFTKSQQRLQTKDFNQNPTRFAQRLRFYPLQGKERLEELGPNAGFGTVQAVKNYPVPIDFSGLTSMGIRYAIDVLGQDEKFSPSEIDNLLLPVRNEYDDWGSWKGDIDPKTGRILRPSSIAIYQTRAGEVMRIYRPKEPRPGGFGVIEFQIRSANYNADLLVDVTFAT